MTQCPYCRQAIPDDSAFCDQCGKELMWCPECKRPKRGTECPVCGNDLVPGHLWINKGTEEASPSAKNNADAPGCMPTGPASSGQGDVSSKPSVIPSEAKESPAARLVGNGWRLVLKEGAFGRRGGIWPELGTCQYVSGSHGIIGKAGDGWTITDSGSTNGTYVNGQKLSAGAAVTLKKGDKVRIANLEFTVE